MGLRIPFQRMCFLSSVYGDECIIRQRTAPEIRRKREYSSKGASSRSTQTTLDKKTIFELIGYAGSILVAVSLTMRSFIRLRIVNLIGAALFCRYGVLIGAIPIAVLNGLIVLINVYYLYEAYLSAEYFTRIYVRPDSEYLLHFLTFYDKDIKKFFPEFAYSPVKGQITLFIVRNLVPAGIVVMVPFETDDFEITLDYVIPGYRDFKIGEFAFLHGSRELKKHGINKLYSRERDRNYDKYLRRVGFRVDQREPGSQVYKLEIP